MKKLFTLALVLTTVATTAFSNIPNSVNDKVLNAFTKTYAYAEDIRWELKKDLYKATFKISGQTMFAYYNKRGEQIAVTRNVTISQLPLDLSTELRSGYHSSWLTELFEISAKGESEYYATIEDADHITILKATAATGWVVFKRDKK